MWYFEENAVEEFGAVVKTKLSFIFLKAFTVLLMGIVALGARQTPVVHTKLSPLNGVNSSVRVAPFPIYQLMAIILHQDVRLKFYRPCAYYQIHLHCQCVKVGVSTTTCLQKLARPGSLGGSTDCECHNLNLFDFGFWIFNVRMWKTWSMNRGKDLPVSLFYQQA